MYAAAAAKLHQSCPTLCDPIDGSPPGSPVPGILQARTLEWAVISFSNAWKWKVVSDSLWPMEPTRLLCPWNSPLEWVAMPFFSCFHLYTQIIHINLLLVSRHCQLKKCTMWGFQVKFYLGQNEYCSPGDSTPCCSEKLFQRGKGKGQYICDFGKGRVHAIKHILWVDRFC